MYTTCIILFTVINRIKTYTTTPDSERNKIYKLKIHKMLLNDNIRKRIVENYLDEYFF